ncbi:MAG: hypothetical protein B9S38_02895 [Verrucomicrobiia bacterium Tous-C4TDCM]|nr:MAG: hypothetical protein B9S38_02895 [Verrucomicrobiae bacterium Tous-C4TDCM]
MNHQLRAVGDGADSVAEDVRSLLAATANAVEDHVVEARKRLAGSFESSRNFAERGARRADGFVRGHSYETAAIAFGLGALAILLMVRSPRC